ncbi:hypothetical protein ACFL2Q_00780 [Thermodesulfobacteriota bacterium]
MGSLRSLRSESIRQSNGTNKCPVGFTGSKYDPALDIKELGKLVRRDLKKAYPKGKFSVRTKRLTYGARSMDVVIKDLDFHIVNPDWVRYKSAHPVIGKTAPSHYTREGTALLKCVQEIVDSYNRYNPEGFCGRPFRHFSRTVMFDYDLNGLVERQEFEIAERLGLPTDSFEEEKDKLQKLFQNKKKGKNLK